MTEKPWFVNKRDGSYLGLTWELFNNSPRRPRIGLVGLQQAICYPGLNNAREESRRAVAILGGSPFRQVQIRFIGKGPKTTIEEIQ